MTLKQIAAMDCTCDEESNDLCPACEAANILNEIGEIRRSALYEISAEPGGLNFTITSGHYMRLFVCPVCGGRGTMPHGFYNAWEISTTCAMPEMCRSCQGVGILWR